MDAFLQPSAFQVEEVGHRVCPPGPHAGKDRARDMGTRVPRTLVFVGRRGARPLLSGPE